MAKPQVLSPIPSNIAKNRNNMAKNNNQKKTGIMTISADKDLRSSSSSFSSNSSSAKKDTQDEYLHDAHRLPRQRKPSIISISSCSSSSSSSSYSNQEYREEGEEDEEGVRGNIVEKQKNDRFNKQSVNQSRSTTTQKHENDLGSRNNKKEHQTAGKRTRQAFVEIFSPVRAMRVARAGMKRKHGGGVNGRIVMNVRGGAETSKPRQVKREGNQSTLTNTRGKNKSSSMSDEEERRGTKDSHNQEKSNEDFGLEVDQSPIVSWNEVFKNRHNITSSNLAKYPPRPKHQSREASGSSLRRNMRAMRLSDRDDMEQEQATNSSRRSSARSIQRLASSTSGSRIASIGGSKGGDSRSRRISKAEEDQKMKDSQDTQEDVEGEISENEKARLLQQAPSWQLRRLTKDKLFALHISLGTFEQAQSLELDSYNKQDLVDGIIHSRSHDEPPSSAGSNIDHSQSERSSRNHSINSPTHSMLKRSATNNSIVSYSSEFTDITEVQSESDANDAAGEETEVEPIKKNRKKMYNSSMMLGPSNDRQRELFRKHVKPSAGLTFPTKQDYSNEGSSTRSSSIISPMRRRLRHKGSLVFAASSPIRTRARTRHQSATSLTATQAFLDGTVPYHQRNLRTRGLDELDYDQMMTPKPKNRRRISVPQDEEDSPSSEAENEVDDTLRNDKDDEDMDEWEDTSPTVARKRSNRTPRKAKLRAQAQLHQTLEEDSEAMVESVLRGEDEDDESDGMSFDETITKTLNRGPLRKGTVSTPPLSEMSLDDDEEEDEEVIEILSDDDEDHDKPSDLDVSPSKMRKLRNGKLRLPNVLTANQRQEKEDVFDHPSSDEQVNDTEMGYEEQQEYSHAALNRLKRDKLIELCQSDSIHHAKDATRAILIDTLLEHHNQNKDMLISGRTERPDSASSSRTARPESSTKSRSSRGRRNETTSEKPLLLRTRSLKHESHSKPGTPVPSAHEEDLNGLDLESLQLVDKEIAFNKLEKLDKIGSGGFKDVYVGKYHISKKTTRKVAIADIRDQLSEMDIKELTLLRDLKHENIVRFIGVCIPPAEMRLTPCMIVSELCANGDLYDYVRNVEAPPDEEIFRIMLETARGLEYLHLRTPAIIHRDCKSSNVLITRNKTAKINDFGLARVRNSKRSMIKSLVGTVNWQAVELWTPKPNYNEKVDVWSAAMTFWEALQWHQPEKKYPFQDMNEHQIYQDVGQKKLRPPTISIRRRYGSEIVELLDRMWDQNPKLRPTMTEVCEEMERLVQLKKDAAAAAAAILSAEPDLKENRKKTNTTTRNASR